MVVTVDLVGVDSGLLQMEIQQDPGPGTALTIHKPDIRLHQIGNPLQAARVPGCHQQALLADRKGHVRRRARTALPG